METNRPLVSVVTVTFNSESTVFDTIKSVNEQTYPAIEHVIVDGASTDGTVALVRSHAQRLGRMVSQRDEGAYDAMNKGIDLSSGELIGVLNSDDVLASPTTIATVVEAYEQNNADVVYGNISYVAKDDPSRVRRKWRTGPYRPGAFAGGWHPPHPAFYATAGAYDRAGRYRTDLRISADFELMLRMLERYQLSSTYVDTTLVRMRLGGQSNRLLRNVIVGNWNCMRAFSLNGLSTPWLYPIRRALFKFEQLRSLITSRRTPMKGND